MQAKQKPVEQFSLADLDVGDAPPTQTVVSAERAAEKGPGEVLQGDDLAIARVADLLAEAKVI
jgi:electron transfer flavoprotein alpha/beta subunit